MKFHYVTVFIVVGSTIVGGCSIFDKNLGSSVNSNTSAQLVDPYAGHAESVSTLDGQKAEKLLTEYRTEKAKAPTEKLLKDLGN